MVLVDIRLGEESGFDLARRLSGIVILISTHAQGEYAEEIAASPAAGFISQGSAVGVRGPAPCRRPNRLRTLARVEERDHGKHPALILPGGQPQLPQDGWDVLFDRRLRDPQRVRNTGVGAALGHQREHLALARPELVERIPDAARGDELLHERGIDDGAALQDAPERVEELPTSVTRVFRR